MDTQTLRASARQWIKRFDGGAHRAIAGWRCGADRVGSAARRRWDTAFAESGPNLSEETRRNERAVDTLVDAARAAVAGRMPR